MTFLLILISTVLQMGDATNLVLILAGELLKKAENLIIMGLHPNDILQGYELACIKALAELESKHIFITRYLGLYTTLQRNREIVTIQSLT